MVINFLDTIHLFKNSQILLNIMKKEEDEEKNNSFNCKLLFKIFKLIQSLSNSRNSQTRQKNALSKTDTADLLNITNNRVPN